MDLIELESSEYYTLYDYMYPIWHETYKDVIPFNQINFLLDKYFKIENIKEFINKGYKYFKIFDNELIGYVVITNLEDSIYLDKLYISNKFRGKGYPKLVFNELLKYNKDITLNVNQNNKRAVSCYKKNGFLIDKIDIINLGEGMINMDYKMRLYKNYNVINVLKERRSVRGFSDKDVSFDLINEIVEASLYAPSSRGRQLTKLLVVKNKELIKEMSKINGEILGVNSDPFYNANVVIVVFADKTNSNYVEDGSLVMGNLMNAAYALDVDSIWIHRAHESFETERGKEIKKQFNIPDNYVGVGNCCLGYRKDDLPKAIDRLEGRVIIAE